MRILLLANHANRGGITTYLLTLAKGLVAGGHFVGVVTSGGEMVPEFERIGCRHFTLNVRMKSELSPFLFANLPALLRIIRGGHFEVLHAQTRVTAMLASWAGRFAGVPYVTTCHGYFKLHLGRKMVPLWGRRVIAVSTPVKRHLVEDLGVKEADVDLVFNGVDLEGFPQRNPGEKDRLRRDHGIASGPVIGIVARLSDVKRHADLIEAVPAVVQKFPTLQCFIFGQGGMEDELRALVKARGVAGSVKFAPVEGPVADHLSLLDVFVFPSESEGLGLSVMEAMASGVPVVSTRVGGLADIVKDGETAVAVPVRNPAAIADAVIRLLADHAFADQLAGRARALMAGKFSSRRMVEGTIQVYQKTLEPKR